MRLRVDLQGMEHRNPDFFKIELKIVEKSRSRPTAWATAPQNWNENRFRRYCFYRDFYPFISSSSTLASNKKLKSWFAWDATLGLISLFYKVSLV